MAFTAPPVGPVATPAAEVTTADLAAFASVPDSASLQPYVGTALRKVILACGPITAGQWRFAIPQTTNSRRLGLTRWPTVTLASIDGLADPLGVDCLAQLTPNTDIDWRMQAVLAPYLLAGLWQITATLTRPADDASSLKLAVKIIAKNLYEVQRGGGARPGAFNDQGAPPMWSGVPSRAKEIMKPYLARFVG